MIILDGSYGEGGGQILRTALVLSLLTDQPFRIENIRLGRTNPGLKAQHLHIIKALLEMSDGRAEGVHLGSLIVTFYPGTIAGGVYKLEIGTAGAIPLFLQTVLPVAMFADSSTTLTIGGGTDVRGAMTIDFWRSVLLPFMQPYTERLELQVNRHGFYPAGGGQVKFRVHPRFNQQNWATLRNTAPPLALPERGALQKVRLFSCASQSLAERRVAERQATAFRRQAQLDGVVIKHEYVDSLSPGSSITAVAEYEYTRLGADALGERNKPADKVGQEAAQTLLQEMATTATVDRHTADNLMLWAALFHGHYSFAESTGHIVTNAWTIQQFLPGALVIEGNEVRG